MAGSATSEFRVFGVSEHPELGGRGSIHPEFGCSRSRGPSFSGARSVREVSGPPSAPPRVVEVDLPWGEQAPSAQIRLFCGWIWRR
uniref:Uncharacterized protein n=1 Tax=Oryza rufipogon TaxID=4529 RepID=A0A0E0QQX3_ORYRU